MPRPSAYYLPLCPQDKVVGMILLQGVAEKVEHASTHKKVSRIQYYQDVIENKGKTAMLNHIYRHVKEENLISLYDNNA